MFKLKEMNESNIKCKYNKGKFINDRGITVMALIITVIVLLILSGITIATLTGENGLINNARKRKRTSRNR